ncbi:chymotrypsin-2-like [Neocloeon triangulifer]|uniref:chymotrypsin-2-like n=1 Tax=Neocloeon triangulifer TaxID=2078957 RepID=UPI00286F4934|nr:chymotrypsin-2-like [Neocloeon triangulifer]
MLRLLWVLMMLSTFALAKDAMEEMIDASIDGRFTGGADATAVKPYVATIVPLGLYQEASVFCGGAMINATLILTTASCMFGGNAAIVTAGALSANLTAELEAQVTYMQEIWYHPLWARNTHIYDMAIIRVYPPFNMTNYVYPIKLAKSSLIKGDALVKATSLMWYSFGNYNDSHSPDMMKETAVKQLPTKTCATYYIKPPFWYKLQPTSFCVVPSATVGICPGDPGSPLIVQDPKSKQFYLAGLAAMDTDQLCPLNATLTNLHTPDLFTRIDPFYKWILAMGGPKAS